MDWPPARHRVVAMGGDRIEMPNSALLMIHRPHAGAIGDAEELRKTADLLDKVGGQIIDAYMRKATIPRSEIERLVGAETWLKWRRSESDRPGGITFTDA